MCRLLAKAYEMAKTRGEKCALCAAFAFLLSMPLLACADETGKIPCVTGGTDTSAVTEVIVTEVPCPSKYLAKLVMKVTGLKFETPIGNALAKINADAVVRQARYGGPLYVFQ